MYVPVLQRPAHSVLVSITFCLVRLLVLVLFPTGPSITSYHVAFGFPLFLCSSGAHSRTCLSQLYSGKIKMSLSANTFYIHSSCLLTIKLLFHQCSCVVLLHHMISSHNTGQQKLSTTLMIHNNINFEIPLERNEYCTFLKIFTQSMPFYPFRHLLLCFILLLSIFSCLL